MRNLLEFELATAPKVVAVPFGGCGRPKVDELDAEPNPFYLRLFAEEIGMWTDTHVPVRRE